LKILPKVEDPAADYRPGREQHGQKTRASCAT